MELPALKVGKPRPTPVVRGGITNNRDKEMYPTENVYITEAVRNFFKKEETENVMDELEDIQDKLDRIEKKLEEDASKKNISFSSDAEKKELYGKPDFLK